MTTTDLEAITEMIHQTYEEMEERLQARTNGTARPEEMTPRHLTVRVSATDPVSGVIDPQALQELYKVMRCGRAARVSVTFGVDPENQLKASTSALPESEAPAAGVPTEEG